MWEDKNSTCLSLIWEKKLKLVPLMTSSKRLDSHECFFSKESIGDRGNTVQTSTRLWPADRNRSSVLLLQLQETSEAEAAASWESDNITAPHTRLMFLLFTLNKSSLREAQWGRSRYAVNANADFNLIRLTLISASTPPGTWRRTNRSAQQCDLLHLLLLLLLSLIPFNALQHSAS